MRKSSVIFSVCNYWSPRSATYWTPWHQKSDANFCSSPDHCQCLREYWQSSYKSVCTNFQSNVKSTHPVVVLLYNLQNITKVTMLCSCDALLLGRSYTVQDGGSTSWHYLVQRQHGVSNEICSKNIMFGRYTRRKMWCYILLVKNKGKYIAYIVTCWC